MLLGSPDYYDQAYLDEYAPKIQRISHRWFRAKISGEEHIPDGPFIGVGNHSGGIMIPDVFVWLSHYHSLKRKTPLVAFTNPAVFKYYPKRVARALTKLGAINGHIKTALRALDQGKALQIYPGGDLDACRPFWQRNKIVLDNKKLYVRLAAKSGYPILPVVSQGAHNGLVILWSGKQICRWFKLKERINLQAFPLALCLPWGAWLGPPPGYIPWPSQIKIKILPPVYVKDSVLETHETIERLMQSELSRMANAKGI